MRLLSRRAGPDEESRQSLLMADAQGVYENFDGIYNGRTALRVQDFPKCPYPVPEDCFIHCLQYLSGKDKVNAALVCRAWKDLVYNPYLWPRLDLSNYATAVHNVLLEHILSKSAMRFTELKTLRLEGCTALTAPCLEVIAENCPDLEVLLLTGCSNIHYKAVLNVIPRLQNLKRLELFGVTEKYEICEIIRRKMPWVDLGMFWLEYLGSIGNTDPLMMMSGDYGARKRYKREITFNDDLSDEENEVDLLYADDEKAPDVDSLLIPPNQTRDFQFGQLPEGAEDRFQDGPPPLTNGECRFAGGFGAVGGCYGAIKGRVIYSNQDYNRSGNYPREVLYYCHDHREQDEQDQNLYRCHACKHFMRMRSFFGENEMTCIVCHDELILQNAQIWIPLTTTGIKNFTFNHVLQHTLSVADRRNLPRTLKRQNQVSCTLDLAMDNQDEEVDPTRAPIKPFWEANADKIRTQENRLRKALKAAKAKNETRSVLLYNGNQRVEVWADKGLLFDGRKGQDYVNLTIQAWGEFYNIMGPIVAMLIAVILFLNQINSFTNGASFVGSYPLRLPDQPTETTSTQMYLIYGAGILFSLLVVLVCFWQLRDRFEAFFRYFMVLDIFVILFFGLGLLIVVSADNLNISADKFSMFAIVWNLSVVGLLTFYQPVSPVLHRIFIVVLFGLMAIIISAVLSVYVIACDIIVAALDLFAMYKPSFADHFHPFLLPTDFPLQNQTPRIFYEVNGLRLRATDFMFYGMLASVVISSTGATSTIEVSVAVGYIFILTGIVLCVYVLPFFSKKVRPLPIAVILMLIGLLLNDQIIGPYVTDDKLRWTLRYP